MGDPIPNGQPWKHTYDSIIRTGRIYLELDLHVQYIDARNNDETEAMTVTERKEGDMRRVDGSKGEEERM